MDGYDELAGSPRESITEGSGSAAERQFLIPFNERLTFGENLVSTGYPHLPQTRMVAINLQPWTEDLLVGGEILDPSKVTADYGEGPSVVTVQYGPDYTQKDWPTKFPKPDFRNGTELRFQIRGSAQFLTIRASDLKWEDDANIPVKAGLNNVILIPMSSFQIQWDFVDDPPIDRLEGLMGKVNEDEFLGSEPETILFETYEVTESFRASTDDPHTNRVAVQMTKRRIENGQNPPYGWNHDYREEPAGWAKLLMSDGKPRYKIKPFGDMFS